MRAPKIVDVAAGARRRGENRNGGCDAGSLAAKSQNASMLAKCAVLPKGSAS